MTLGEQIRQVRRNRGMTQKELGMRLGCPENSADVRIAQYETEHRMPKKERLEAIAKVLEVNPEIFCRRSPDSEKELMKMLLWMDETDREWVQVGNPEKMEKGSVLLVFTEEAIQEFLKEWMKQKDRLNSHEISEREYQEWKWSKPALADE